MCAYRGTQHSSELHIFFKVVLVDNSVKINILCNVSIQKKTFIKILYRALMNINILLDFDAIRHNIEVTQFHHWCTCMFLGIDCSPYHLSTLICSHCTLWARSYRDMDWCIIHYCNFSGTSHKVLLEYMVCRRSQRYFQVGTYGQRKCIGSLFGLGNKRHHIPP